MSHERRATCYLPRPWLPKHIFVSFKSTSNSASEPLEQVQRCRSRALKCPSSPSKRVSPPPGLIRSDWIAFVTTPPTMFSSPIVPSVGVSAKQANNRSKPSFRPGSHPRPTTRPGSFPEIPARTHFRPLLRPLSPAAATPRHSHLEIPESCISFSFFRCRGGRPTPQGLAIQSPLYFPFAKVASPIHNRFPAQSSGRNLDISRSRRRQFPNSLTLLRTCVVALLCVPIWIQNISQTTHVTTKMSMSMKHWRMQRRRD